MKKQKVVVCYHITSVDDSTISKAEAMLAAIWLAASSEKRKRITHADKELCAFLEKNPHHANPSYVDPKGVSKEVIFRLDWDMLRVYYRTIKDEATNTLYVIIGAYRLLY